MAEEVHNEFAGTANGMVVQAHTVNFHMQGANSASDGTPRRIDFTGYEQQKRTDFTGRRWLFEQVDAWLSDTDEQVLLITGPPGIGKSAFLAELAHRSGRPRLLAHYFCMAEDRTTLDPAAFVEHLAAELAATPAEFGTPAGTGAPFDRAAVERNPGHALDQTVIGSLRRPPGDDQPRVILIDGLDESLTGHGRRDSIVGLLAPRLPRFPRHVRFVLTSRPTPQVLTALGTARVLAIEAEESRNFADVAELIDRRMAGPAWPDRLREQRLTAGAAAYEIRRAAWGSPLYATMLLTAVELGRTPLSALAELPPGLSGAYELFLDRHFGDPEAYAAARPVLEALLAAEEPLPQDVLAAVSGLDPSYRLPSLFRELAPLLPERRGRRVFFHRSLAEWFAEPGHPYHAAPASGRRRLAQGFLDYLQSPGPGPVHHEPPTDPTALYWAQHGLDHLAAAGDILPDTANPAAFVPVAVAGQDHIWSLGAFTKHGVPTRMRRYVEGLLRPGGYQGVRNLLVLLREAVIAFYTKDGLISGVTWEDGHAVYQLGGSVHDGYSVMAALKITGFAGSVFRAARDSRGLALTADQLSDLADRLNLGRYLAGGLYYAGWADDLGAGGHFLAEAGEFLNRELHELTGGDPRTPADA
ncbi:AAA family ATPase [Kitasatospora sp. NPDC094011]|uniref:AAA family ATPase n=1 Tax=Kitasatospora sp. NPDC094011 TaxID=3364090 RepID=UPI0037FB4B75